MPFPGRVLRFFSCDTQESEARPTCSWAQTASGCICHLGDLFRSQGAEQVLAGRQGASWSQAICLRVSQGAAAAVTVECVKLRMGNLALPNL